MTLLFQISTHSPVASALPAAALQWNIKFKKTDPDNLDYTDVNKAFPSGKNLLKAVRVLANECERLTLL